MYHRFFFFIIIFHLFFFASAESVNSSEFEIKQYDSLLDLRFQLVEKEKKLKALEQQYRNRDALGMGFAISGLATGGAAFISHCRMIESYASYKASSNTVKIRGYRADTEFLNIARISLAGIGIVLTGGGLWAGISSGFLIGDIADLKQEIFIMKTELLSAESVAGESAE